MMGSDAMGSVTGTTWQTRVSGRNNKGRLLTELAFKDVVHERLMSFCVIVALAGLVAPLLVLFGLKHGVIKKLQDELIQDPVNRELKPAETKQYPPELFTDIRSMSDVSFMVESVTESASVIRATTTSGQSRLADMLPTAAGDPLLLENLASVPAVGEVVLSAGLADALNVGVNDRIELSAQRTENGDVVRADTQVTVRAVLPLRADVLQRAYVPWRFARDIESFREGFAVPDRRWPGASREVLPGYQSIVFGLDRELSATEGNRLLVNSDFFHLNAITEAEFSKKLGLRAPANLNFYEVSVIDRLASATSLQRVSQRLKIHGALIWPWNTPMTAQLSIGRNFAPRSSGDTSDLDNGQTIMLHVDGSIPIPATAIESEAGRNREAAAVSPAVGHITRKDADSLGLNLTLTAPLTVILMLELQGLPLSLPMLLALKDDDHNSLSSSTEATPIIGVRASLLGQLAKGKNRSIQFNESLGTLERQELGARGFRLYADSIYSVETVRDALLDRQIPTHSSLQAIIKLQALDKGLTSLFVLIAVAGVGTSIIVLVANQIANVQRKRESIAQVRLLGLSKAEVALLPLFTGTYLSLAGGFSGIGIALSTAWAINRFYAASLGFDTAVCVISGAHLWSCMAIVLILTALSSMVAALWINRVDPAEAMRHE